MKALAIIILSLFFSTAFAQAPQKMSYQMVIRNSSNAVVANQSIGIRVSILQGGASGSIVFSETHTPSSNANGLVSFIIGNGTSTTGSFSAINWATGPYFIKTEADPAGGTNYTITATSELLSVPYALFAAKSPGNGKTYFILEDSVTNAEAAARVAEDLGEATQFIWVRNTTQLTNLDLSKATNLIELIITGNSALTQVSLSNLRSVYSQMSIQSNASLTSFACPQLKNIIGTSSSVNISSNASLTTLSMPLLEKAGNSLTFISNAQLNSINLASLRNVGNGLTITGSRLTSLNFPMLNTAQHISIAQSTVSFPVSMPQLIRVNSLTIGNSSGSCLATLLDLPLLDTATTLTIQNTTLTNISLPGYRYHSGAIKISGNTSLTSIQIPQVNRIGFNGTGLSAPDRGSEIDLSGNALSSTMVNSLLAKLVALQVKYRLITLTQVPAAPPTGQGLTDKATLQALNIVNTD